ncbi:hypothetical protein ID866_7116 [Astraeus odoratus]|nr:hypothetical protein ID866_7116 [Astraeus odoratus]
MWDKVKDRQLASSRAAQLEGNLWKPLMDKGARHERFLGNNRASAWEIVRGLTADAEPLLLQEELVDFERRLNETTAGRATNSQFQRLLQEQKETIKQLQEEAKAQKDPALARELQAEYDRIEAQLQKTWDEIEKEKVPLTRRIGLFFFKKTRARKLQMNLPQ